jgi:hypothetical protein
MQAEMDEGLALETIAAGCADDADANRTIIASFAGIDSAVGILSAQWEHGDSLLKWYTRRSNLN